MGDKNVQESQQQSSGITLGTQGNAPQPTPHGDDIQYPQMQPDEDRSIPNQDRSSAANQQRSNERGEETA